MLEDINNWQSTVSNIVKVNKININFNCPNQKKALHTSDSAKAHSLWSLMPHCLNQYIPKNNIKCTNAHQS